MSKLLVIVGSTRPGRAADLVLPWLTEKVSAHGAFDAEVVDLRDWPLPIFGEHFGTIGDFSDPTYSEPLVKAWNDKIKSADAFVIVTPEYNYGYPASVKNAIDYLHREWQHKPVGFVSYGGVAAGTRAVQQLKQVVTTLRMLPVTDSVNIPFYNQFLDSDGVFQPNAVLEQAADAMLDELVRTEAALRPLRSSGTA